MRSVCLKLRSCSSDSSATASSESSEEELSSLSLLRADGLPTLPNGLLDPYAVLQLPKPRSATMGDVAEASYWEYVEEYVVDTLKEDAYFTGYLAATAKCKTFGQWIHAMFTIAVLLFSIFCQAGMICFMRLEQHQEEPDFTDLDFYAKLFMLQTQTEHISSNVSPGLLFLGTTTFLMQVAGEQKQVDIYRRAINLVDPTRKWCSFVTMLQIAKITMPFAMRVVGIHVLFSSTSNMDVILNCTALTFVFSLDDIAMSAACPCMSRAMHAAQDDFMTAIKCVEVEPLSSWSSAWQAIATFICCICFGALVEYFAFTSSSQ